MRKVFFFWVSLNMIIPTVLVAQEVVSKEKWGHMYINGNLQMGIPIESFKSYLNVPGFGGGGLFVIPIKRDVPLSLGAEFSVMTYATESQDFSANIAGFWSDFRFTTSSNIFLGHVVMRIQPAVDGPLRPYVDGMAGFKNLYTRNRLEDLYGDEDNDFSESETIKGDWAFSYGGAIGLQLAVFRNPGIMIDLRCAYLPGNNASYLVRKDDAIFDFNNPREAFEERESPTTILMPQIGVTFDLNFHHPEEVDSYDD